MISDIIVVHCKRSPFDMMIDRTTKWGNPFKIGPDGDRAMVLEKYQKWLIAHRQDLIDSLYELDGKTLGCWCAPNDCHGHILASLRLAQKHAIAQLPAGFVAEYTTDDGCIVSRVKKMTSSHGEFIGRTCLDPRRDMAEMPYSRESEYF